MADEEGHLHVVEGREKALLDHLNSFLVACSGPPNSMSNVDKVQCATVLLRSLPCARHAVLEQLCDVFHESMHKYMVEMERRAQLGGTPGTPEVVDADLDNALHKVCDVVRSFIEVNPMAWAPIICQVENAMLPSLKQLKHRKPDSVRTVILFSQLRRMWEGLEGHISGQWCLNLLGDLISKFDQKRGVSLTLSFSEGFHKWMSFPPVQMLMGITTHCCSKLVLSNPDECMETLLQIAIRYSPHLDWVVAHIVSHFHDVIVKKLLCTALKDYSTSFSEESEEKSVLVSTVVQVLGYLSIQYAQEIKTHLLALFHTSISQDPSNDKEIQEQLATIPFLLHIASLSPKLLKGTLSEFVEAFSSSVLVRLYEQSVQRAALYHKHGSLIPALVDIITNIETGAYDIFLFFLENCCPSDDEETMETGEEQQEVQQTFVLILERLLVKLQHITSQRHKLYTQKAAIAPLDTSCTESAFLLEMARYSTQLCQSLVTSTGPRFSWVFRMTVLVAIHSGEPAAVQILTHIILNSRSNESLNLFVHMQCKLEFYYPLVLKSTVKKCAGFLTFPAATLKASKVIDLLENFHQLVQAEKSQQFPPRCKIVDQLEEHYTTLATLIGHPNAHVAAKSLSVLLTFRRLVRPTAGSKGCVCRTVITLFISQLKELFNRRDTCKDVLDRIKLCNRMLVCLAQDEFCRILIIRLLVESALEKDKAKYVGNTEQVDDNNRNGLMEDSKVSLLEYNLKPHISSRLPLSPSSVFFTGVIGNKHRNGLNRGTISKPHHSRTWLQTSQVYLDLVSTVCSQGNGDEAPDPEEASRVLPANTDQVASLLMETVCPDVVPCVGEWPEEESMKSTIERDLKIRKKFDDNPILWWLLVVVSRGVSSLCKCSPLMSSLLATIMSCWDVCRDKQISQSSELFRDTDIVTYVMVEAKWLPAPICRVSGVLHLLSPQEIYTVLNTMWKVLKEYPPHPGWSTEAVEQRWQQGAALSQKEVLKAIFINNISTLGQHYARVFQPS